MLWSQYVNIIHLALLSQPLPSSLKISKQVTSASLATFIVTNYDSWTSDLASSQPRDHLDRIRNNYRDPSKIYGRDISPRKPADLLPPNDRRTSICRPMSCGSCGRRLRQPILHARARAEFLQRSFLKILQISRVRLKETLKLTLKVFDYLITTNPIESVLIKMLFYSWRFFVRRSSGCASCAHGCFDAMPAALACPSLKI